MKLTMVALLLSLFAILAWAGTLKDDFSDGDFDGWTVPLWWGAKPVWKIDESSAACDRPSVWPGLLAIGELDWTDYTVECDVRFAKLYPILAYRYAEIFLRHIDTNNFVYFNLADQWGNLYNKQAFSSVVINGQQNYKEDKDIAIETERWYHLKASVSKKHYLFWIDDTKITDYFDDRIPSGKIAFGVGGAHAYFDNIVITGDDVPDMNLSVNQKGKLATTWSKLKQ